MTTPDDPATDPAAAARADRIEAARRAGFYPLMLLLNRLLGDSGQVGTESSPREERIRFRHDPALEFSVADVAQVVEALPPPDPDDFGAERRSVVQILTTFLGLTGAVSPLPQYLAEEIIQEDQEQPRQRDFLDLFHHRMLSFFYRARARSDWPGGYRSDQTDAWSRRVLALLGREDGTRGGGGAPPWQLLRWAGLLAERCVPASALAAALEDALSEELGEAGVQIEELAGAWVEIAPAEQNRLGRSGSRLGSDLLVGRRIFDRAGKFRIVVGPLSREGFTRFSHERVPLRRIAEAVRALVVEPLDFEVILWLRPDAVPRLELSARGTTRLGRNSWLGSRTAETRIKVDLPA
jgi:type VI secretion system protein ImpH